MDGRGYIYNSCDACEGEGYLTQEAQWRINDAVSSYGYGEITTDGSINCGEDEEGLEFRSRILHVEEDGWTGIEAEANRVMRILRDYDAYSSGDYTCGLHVHICPDNGWDVEGSRKARSSMEELGRRVVYRPLLLRQRRVLWSTAGKSGRR